MNLSDPSADDDSGSETGLKPAKFPRNDSYGASSSSSHGSDSDEEAPDSQNLDIYYKGFKQTSTIRHNDEQSTEENLRLSRSSASENCSSPNDHSDDYRPAFEDNNDNDAIENGEGSKQSELQNATDNFYDKNYSEKSKRMLLKMGYKPGKGLGKLEHGRVEPVEASTQKGRRGLGLKPSTVGEIPQDFEWTPDESKPEAREEVQWINPSVDDPPIGDVLDDWLNTGPKKLTITDEVNFVDAHILKGVVDAKTIFDSLDDNDLKNARSRSNPYETIGSVIFLNRAAVKMANIDAIFDFMFTHPKKESGEDALDKKELLYFADVCAGPGGFSEYVLFRKGWRAKGFGFTLKGPNDFKLSDFYAGSAETFHPFYGVKGDGNVYDPANLMSLKDHVLKQTEDKGVHFLMADGGFSVEGQENIQEILSKQLYLCQCLAGLMLVRTGGHFVVKLFDIFTCFSVSLIYIMYRCFDKVSIHKPVTSRPANSERYLVCMNKRLGTESAEHHLYSINSMLWNGLDDGGDVLELVPLNVIQQDTAFFEYIYKSNCVLGERQIKSLLKIAAFSKDKNLRETSQADMKEQCLQLWQLPDKVRTRPERCSPDETLSRIIASLKKLPPDSQNPQSFKSNILNKQPRYLEKSLDLDIFRNVYNWHLMFLSCGKNSPDLRIFLGCGGKQVFQLEQNGWRNAIDLHLILPAKTLIYAEVVKEYRGQGNNQMHSKALHIIDAIMLGGVDISHCALTERINQCNLFCSSLYKPFDSQSLPIRCKRLFNMENFSTAINNLEYRGMKRVKKAVTINTPDRIFRTDMFHTVGSVLFIKEIKEPWSAQISKSSGYKYYFSIGKDKEPRSEYYIPDEARLDAISAFSNRLMWSWEPSPSAVFDGQPHSGVPRAHVEELVKCNVMR